MGFLRDLFGKKNGDISSSLEEDSTFLQAEPISRKRMDLLWLDPPRLAQLETPLIQYKVITVTMGDSSNLRDHEFTMEDFQWAKQVEQIVNKAFTAGQRGKYREAIQHYQNALKLAPGCDLFLMSIGVSYAQLGQKERAVQYLQRANQISPTNMRIVDNLKKAQTM